MLPIKFNKYFILLILLIIVSLFMNYRSLNYFLFQDDFYNFNITQINSPAQFLGFFNFRSDIIAYRPISLLLYFFTLKSLFGFNALAFRVVSFGIFFLSVSLTYGVILKISKDKRISLLTASLWSLSSIHFMSLSQINYNMIGTLFFLLTTDFFLSSKKVNSKNYIFAFFCYLLSIGSFEFAVTWPFIFSFFYFFVLKNKLRNTIMLFLPFFIITVGYFILRVVYIKAPPIPEYHIAFNLESIKALFWYFLWTFNIPEEFKKQVVSKLIILNEDFLWQYWILISQVVIGALWMWFLGFIFTAFSIYQKKLAINQKLVLFFTAWFFIGISPVLLLPNHSFIMYLTMPAIGMFSLISYLIIKSRQYFILLLVVPIWLFSSMLTLNFYHTNSYTVVSQKFSGVFLQESKLTIPKLNDWDSVYYPLEDRQSRQALMDQEIVKAIYKNQTVSIYYNKYDLIQDFESNKIKGFVYVFIRP